MQNSIWGSDFFHTPYQLACQLGLYCEAEDGLYYPRFDHDIDESEAREYLEFWIPRYYVPNPYVGRNGFNSINCPTYVLKELYCYAHDNPNCTYSEAYRSVFHEEANNNNDIVKNYINNYSKVLRFEADGRLTITEINPKTVFDFMNRSDKKGFFDNFSKEPKEKNIGKFPLQQIFYGAPGTGKSHTIQQITDAQPKENVFRTTFHPDSDYSTFVGCYKPTTVEVPMRDVTGKVIKENGADVTENRIVYKFVPQAFTKAYLRAWQTTAPVFLIIEEINRGNCAQIFGDLFQLLDRKNGASEYPIKPDADLGRFIADKLTAPVENIPNEVRQGKELSLPANLHIWATMNTSDQSLFPIDSAFKRRWEWKYIPIDTRKERWSIHVDGTDYDWSDFLEKINAKIETATSSEDKMLGFYFCKAENNVVDAERFVNKVAFYLWNDVFKEYGFDDAIFNDENGDKLTFRKFYKNDGTVDEAKVKKFLDNLGVAHQEASTNEETPELQ